MNYYRYRIRTTAQSTEILLAYLSELTFESFEETMEGLDAYVAANEDLEAIEVELAALQTSFSFEFVREEIPYRNWNAEWEANFQPIKVEDFCGVRADFHPPMLDVKYDLIINPKMAFGTGHHETTYMMIHMMRDLNFKNTKVLDYGCGTGILAILAAQMGASTIDAVDIEVESYQNTMENAQINQVDTIQAIHGTLDHIFDSGYDIILANINRNVILDSLAVLHQKLNRRGVLLISGVLKRDVDLLKKPIEKLRMTVDETLERGDWACLKLLK